MDTTANLCHKWSKWGIKCVQRQVDAVLYHRMGPWAIRRERCEGIRGRAGLVSARRWLL